MSHTEHIIGTLTKIEENNLEKFAEEYINSKGIVRTSHYYDNSLEELVEEFPKDFFLYRKTGTLYSILSKEIDPEEEIITAKIIKENIIEFELKFYNGGGSLDECLEEALDKLNL